MVNHLRSEGWWALRSPASKGCVDVVAARAVVKNNGQLLTRLRFIEVKSTVAGPFHSFGPEDRAELLEEAGHAGATAELAWWPPRGKLQWLGVSEWPGRP